MAARLAGMQASTRNSKGYFCGIPKLAGKTDTFQALTKCRYLRFAPCVEPWQVDRLNRDCGDRASSIKPGGC